MSLFVSGNSVVFPQFSGENPADWLYAMEDVFEEFQVPMEKYVDIAIHCLHGAAWKWAWNWAYLNPGMALKGDWCAFSYNLLWTFDPSTKVVEQEEDVSVHYTGVKEVSTALTEVSIAVEEYVLDEVNNEGCTPTLSIASMPTTTMVGNCIDNDAIIKDKEDEALAVSQWSLSPMSIILSWSLQAGIQVAMMDEPTHKVKKMSVFAHYCEWPILVYPNVAVQRILCGDVLAFKGGTTNFMQSGPSAVHSQGSCSLTANDFKEFTSIGGVMRSIRMIAIIYEFLSQKSILIQYWNMTLYVAGLIKALKGTFEDHQREVDSYDYDLLMVQNGLILLETRGYTYLYYRLGLPKMIFLMYKEDLTSLPFTQEEEGQVLVSMAKAITLWIFTKETLNNVYVMLLLKVELYVHIMGYLKVWSRFIHKGKLQLLEVLDTFNSLRDLAMPLSIMGFELGMEFSQITQLVITSLLAGRFPPLLGLASYFVARPSPGGSLNIGMCWDVTAAKFCKLVYTFISSSRLYNGQCIHYGNQEIWGGSYVDHHGVSQQIMGPHVLIVSGCCSFTNMSVHSITVDTVMALTDFGFCYSSCPLAVKIRLRLYIRSYFSAHISFHWLHLLAPHEFKSLKLASTDAVMWCYDLGRFLQSFYSAFISYESISVGYTQIFQVVYYLEIVNGCVVFLPCSRLSKEIMGRTLILLSACWWYLATWGICYFAMLYELQYSRTMADCPLDIVDAFSGFFTSIVRFSVNRFRAGNELTSAASDFPMVILCFNPGILINFKQARYIDKFRVGSILSRLLVDAGTLKGPVKQSSDSPADARFFQGRVFVGSDEGYLMSQDILIWCIVVPPYADGKKARDLQATTRQLNNAQCLEELKPHQQYIIQEMRMNKKIVICFLDHVAPIIERAVAQITCVVHVVLSAFLGVSCRGCRQSINFRWLWGFCLILKVAFKLILVTYNESLKVLQSDNTVNLSSKSSQGMSHKTETCPSISTPTLISLTWFWPNYAILVKKQDLVHYLYDVAGTYFSLFGIVIAVVAPVLWHIAWSLHLGSSPALGTIWLLFIISGPCPSVLLIIHTAAARGIPALLMELSFFMLIFVMSWARRFGKFLISISRLPFPIDLFHIHRQNKLRQASIHIMLLPIYSSPSAVLIWSIACLRGSFRMPYHSVRNSDSTNLLLLANSAMNASDSGGNIRPGGVASMSLIINLVLQWLYLVVLSYGALVSACLYLLLHVIFWFRDCKVRSPLGYLGEKTHSSTHNRGNVRNCCMHALPAIIQDYVDVVGKHMGLNIQTWDPGIKEMSSYYP